MKNKEFLEIIRTLTTPQMTLKDLAKELGTSYQNLRYHAVIRPSLYPDQESKYTDKILELMGRLS